MSISFERYRPATRSAGSAILRSAGHRSLRAGIARLNPVHTMKNGRSCRGIRHPRDGRSRNDDDVDARVRRNPRVGVIGKDGGIHSVRRRQIHQAGQSRRNRDRHGQGQNESTTTAPERTGFRLPSRRGTLPAT